MREEGLPLETCGCHKEGKLGRIKGGKTEDVNPRLEMQENTTGCSSESKPPVCRGCVALFSDIPSLLLTPTEWTEACLEG